MSIIFRRGTLNDNSSAFRVFQYAIAHLLHRQGVPDVQYPPVQEEIEQEWNKLRSLYEHLTRTAEHYWVAEEDGEIVGYSRSSNHHGVRQLNELFVLPDLQAQGVGKELLARAFPRENAQLRLVIATPNVRAQSLYMRSGVYARGLIYNFSCTPQQISYTTDLSIEPAPASPDALSLFAEVDRDIVGFQHDNDHIWLMSNRQGWVYRRQGQVVGYGYTGAGNGPFALLNPADFPAVIAHAEHQAAQAGRTNLALCVHSANRHAIDYLLARRYTASPFIVTLLSDAPFGRLDHYINTDPSFIL